MRVIGLTGAPPGFSNHEISELRLVDAVRAGQVVVFYDVGDTEGAREGLYYQLLAAFTGLVGDGLYGYRLLTIFSNLLALAFTYGIARQLFGTTTALLTLSMMALGYWPLFTARSIGREALMPFFASAALYYLVRGFMLPASSDEDQMPALRMAAGGFTVGLAFYVHWTSLAILVGFFLFGVYLNFRYPRIAHRQADNVGFAFLITFIIAIPFSVSMLRMRDASALSYYMAHILDALPRSIGDTFSNLFGSADPNPAHNLPGRAVFGPGGALTFLAGVLLIARRFRKPVYALVGAMLAAALLPSIIATEGPDLTRLTVAMPALYLLTGLGAAGIVHYLTGRRRRAGWVVFVLFSLLFVFGGARTLYDLDAWANSDAVFTAYHARLGRLAPHLDATANDIPTTICSHALTVNDPDLLSDRDLLAYMLHQSDLPLRYADCRNSLVIAQGGERQQIAFAYPDGPALFPERMGVWLEGAKVLTLTGLPPHAVFEFSIEAALDDLLGSFITTAPTGFAPESPGGAAPVRLPVRFGGNVTFVGYQIAGGEVYHPGETIEVITYWRVDGQAPSGLNLFVHLLFDPLGAPVAQNDSLGTVVDTLEAEDIFIQHNLLYLPQQMLSGDYDLSVGLYTMPDRVRLPVFDDEQPRGDRLFVRKIYIVGPEADGSDE